MTMYSFFASIHARPDEASAGPVVELDGEPFATLEVPQTLLSQPLDRNFEDTVEALSKLERMFVEPDGSFVWASSQNSAPWQVDGNLHDRDELLLFVDIKGSCPQAEFDRLLMALGWPQNRVMFQLTRQAVFLDESEFRRYAQRCAARADDGSSPIDVAGQPRLAGDSAREPRS